MALLALFSYTEREELLYTGRYIIVGVSSVVAKLTTIERENTIYYIQMILFHTGIIKVLVSLTMLSL